METSVDAVTQYRQNMG